MTYDIYIENKKKKNTVFLILLRNETFSRHVRSGNSIVFIKNRLQVYYSLRVPSRISCSSPREKMDEKKICKTHGKIKTIII